MGKYGNYCPNCGMKLDPTGGATCPGCGKSLVSRSPSPLASRPGCLFGWSVGKADQLGGKSFTISKSFVREEKIRVQDPRTGEIHEYHSLADVPPEFRGKIKELMAGAMPDQGVMTNSLVMRDAMGREKRYNSVEEMPPEVRAMYEKLRSEAEK